MISENNIEQSLQEQVRKAGGLCLKFVSPGYAGVPDRICLFPGGKIAFVELKAPGKTPRPLQVARHRRLRSLGFPVHVIDDSDQVKRMIEHTMGGMKC